jgi:hypothetical protein
MPGYLSYYSELLTTLILQVIIIIIHNIILLFVFCYVMVDKAMSHVTLPRMRQLSPLIHQLPKINGGYFTNSSRIYQ